MTNTQSFAKQEFDILTKTWAINSTPDERPVILDFQEEINALAEKFGLSGQSGGSAPFAASVIGKTITSLLLQKPISPISGFADEWVDMSEESGGELLHQNKRCSAVFQTKEGSYFLYGIIFKSQEGGTFTVHGGDGVEGILSNQFIKSFPFIPKSFYVDVISTEVKPGWWDHKIKDKNQLKKVYRYYQASKPQTKPGAIAENPQ